MTLESLYILLNAGGQLVLAIWVFYLLYVVAMGVYRAYLADRLSLFQKVLLRPLIYPLLLDTASL